MDPFEVEHYPPSRVATFDVGVLGGRKHHVVGLLEIDVTVPRQRIRELLRGGVEVGFISWFVSVLGRTVAENRKVHAVNQGRGRQILFRDVDVSLLLEREVQGVKVPLPTIVRAADTKGAEEIHRELEGVRAREISSAKDYVLTDQGGGPGARLFFKAPQWLRLLAWRFILRSPFSRKKNMGTVLVTNIGMAGGSPGWIIPRSLHNLSFGVGTICRKPWAVRGQVEIREILHLTILFDHDVVDGVPAARFADQLVKNLERGRGLPEGEREG